MSDFEVAVEQQRGMHRLADRGEAPRTWRWESLAPGFKMGAAPWHGTGFYAIDTTTGEVCDCQMEWTPEGDVLICRRCHLDGT